MSLIKVGCGLLYAGILYGACGVAFSAEPFDGLKAGAKAYARGEAARRGAVRQQLQTNEDMRYRAGFPSAIDGTYRFNAPPNLESWYAYGPRGRRAVFEPWYFVPGNIWGYRSQIGADLRQPIGQRHVKTGPNRWESFPVYAPYDLRDAPPRNGANPKTTPALPALEPPALKPPDLEPPVRKRQSPRSL